MSEIIAQRVFSPIYIYLDIAFLVFFCGMLLRSKRYITLLFAIAGGVLYMIVDYGIFHLALGTRSITGGNMFWVLLWMSMSYGITNFAWIWLCLSRDKKLLEWSVLILAWWIACPLIASTFGANFAPIKIQRTTGAYHGFMAIILFVGYAIVCCKNIFEQDKSKKINIVWLLTIGIMVQFAWEFSLLIGGIRSAEIVSASDKFMTMIVNSLVETKLFLPYIYFIHKAITRHRNDDLSLVIGDKPTSMRTAN